MRWTARRKADYLRVLDGVESLTEFCIRHNAFQSDLDDVSAEEIAAWRRLFALEGKEALRATRLQKYRRDQLRRPLGREE